MVKRIGLLAALTVLFAQLTVFAGGLYRTEVRQLYCYWDLLRAYIDAEDSDGNPAEKPEASEVAATIDGSRLTARTVNRFGDTAEGVADIFLIDISGSIKNSQMSQVKAAIRTWAANMKERDRIAIMTFGEDVRSLIDYSNDKDAIDRAVDHITNNDKLTQLYGGLSQALDLTTRSDSGLPKRKNIILITDGINEYSGGVSENDIFEKLKDMLIPVYSMWMPNGGQGKATLNSVTEYSGGKLYDMSDKDIGTVYNQIRDSIRNTYIIDFAYGAAEADDGKHTFSVKLAENGRIAEDSVSFTFRHTTEDSGAYLVETAEEHPAEGEDEESAEEEKPEKRQFGIVKLVLILLGALFLLTAIVTALVLLLKGREENYEEQISGEVYSGGTAGSYPGGGYRNAVYPISSETVPLNVGRNGAGMTITLIPAVGGAALSAAINGTVYAGRGPENNIVIHDELVSGRHCAFTYEDGRVYLEDLGSTNGTVINNVPIKTKTVVRGGETLLLGDSEFTITLGNTD